MSTLANEFSQAIAARLDALPTDTVDLPLSALALRLVEAIGHGDAVDAGMWAMLLHKHRHDFEGIATLALRPMLDVLRREQKQLERSVLENRVALPYGYLDKDGCWYAHRPDAQPLRYGQTRTLIPIWTHNRAVTFRGIHEGRQVVAEPVSDTDRALMRAFLTNEVAQ